MNNNVNSGMRNFWNDTGGHMWIKNQDIITSAMSPLGFKVMDKLTMEEGDKVLDLGSGCGDTTFEISRRIGATGYVLGADISEIMISDANRKIKNKEFRNLDFKCVDAQTYLFENSSFDIIYSRFGAMFFEDPILAFTNMRSALLPGGRLGFICWQPVEKIEWISLTLEVVARHIELPSPQPPEPEAPGGFSFGDVSRVTKILDSAGFDEIQIEPFISKMNIGRNLDEAQVFLTQVGPAGAVIENPDISYKTRNDFVADLRKTLNMHMTQHGIELGAAAWVVTARNMHSR